MVFQSSISYLLIYFITILPLQFPPMWKSFISYLVFAMSFCALSTSTLPSSNSKLRQNWKYVHTLRWRRLDYHLVIYCIQRVHKRPLWLYGTKFTSHCYVTHRRRRGRNPKAKARHHRWWVIKPESNFQMSGDSHFRLHERISPQILDNFCGSIYFTRLPNLISKFQYNNGTDIKAKVK